MEDGTFVTERARLAIGTQCDACGGEIAISCVLDQHRRSGYLIGTGYHVLDDGLTRSLLVATSRANLSTSIFQKLKMKPKHCAGGTVSETISKYAK